jgi:hypothetical protein
MKNKIPTIIFGDTHDDSVNMRIFIKLLPQLKAMGYSQFFDEMPPGFILGEKGTLDEVLAKHKRFIPALVEHFIHPWMVWTAAFEAQIEHLRKREAATQDVSLLNTIRESIEWLQQQITKITQLENLAKSCDADHLDQLLQLQNELENYVTNLPDIDSVFQIKNNLSEALLYRQPSLPFIRYVILFLECLKQYNFAIESVDDVSMTANQESDEYSDYYDADENTRKMIDDPIRDSTMAANYLSATQGVIGRAGLMHIEGIQKNIAAYLSPSKAADKFIFVHVCNDMDENDFLKKDYPLGFVWIDGRSTSDDDIVEIILAKIREHQQRLNHRQLSSFNFPGQRLYVERKSSEMELEEQDLLVINNFKQII